MRDLSKRCSALAFFKGFDAPVIEAIVTAGEWFCLPGGAQLFTEGEASTHLYVVISGRLVVARRSADAGVVGYVRTGEPVGEMSLLAAEAHSASVHALRDTEILALSRETVARLLDESADFASALAMAILARARRPRASFSQAAPRMFALIASSPSIDIESIARELAELISRYGRTVKVLRDSDGDSVDAEEAEIAHDVVLLPARVGDTIWYKFVLRHADRLFVFARRDARPPKPFPLTPFENSPARRFRLVDLVVVHEGQKWSSSVDWVDALDANRIFHWRGVTSRDRLARAIAGRTVALVLSGGGARAYAHIGAVKAMRERGVPIDFIAGSSMGAVIGACAAMGWSDEEISARITDAFVTTNPLGDHVLPVVALTKGELVEERLKKHFGDAMIEDMEAVFLCVSSELTTGSAFVHRRGLLRDALRASISLPGILPPVVDGDYLLVDGAVMNNFPTDLVANIHRGVTFGVDVARRGTIGVEPFREPPNFLNWVRQHGLKEAPPIVNLLMRAATARIDLENSAFPPDILVSPVVEGVFLRDWKKFDEAVEDGYQSMLKSLSENWSKIAPIAEPFGARFLNAP